MTAQQLKNSILQMAVQGKLVPQDPADEPASVLVERIRAEKEQLVKEKKIKKEKNFSHIYRGEDGLFYEKIGTEVRCISEDLPFDVPESWEWVRLGSVVYNRGQVKPKSDFCYIDIGSIDNIKQCLNSEENIVTADKAPSRARKIVALEDILYSTVRPYLHNMCIINKEFSKQPIASTGFAVLTCHIGLHNKFLFYYLMSPNFDNYANHTDNSKGVAYPAINDDRLYKAYVPLPPLAEQQRIVAKYNELLPSIEKYDIAHSKIEKLNKNFPEQLKKSVLQWAVQGKLEEQDPSDEPASVLVERIRAEKEQLVKDGKIKKDKQNSTIYKKDGSYFERTGDTERCIDEEIPFDIPESWEWVRLSSLGLLQTGTTPPTNVPEYFNGDIPFIKPADILNENINYYNESLTKLGSLKSRVIPTKSVLMVCIGGSMGKCAYTTQKVCCNQQINAISPYLCNEIYLMYAMCSDYLQATMKNTAGGTATPIYNKTMWGNLIIPLPPLAEQQRIVDKVDEVLGLLTSRRFPHKVD